VPVEFLVRAVQQLLSAAGDGESWHERPFDGGVEPRVGRVLQLLERADVEQIEVGLTAPGEREP